MTTSSRLGRLGSRKARDLLLSSAAMLPLLFGTLQAAETTAYRLGPQDRIRLRVFEWRATRDEIYAWEALNGEFTIGSDGVLSIPFAGDVPANNQPSRVVATLIGERLRDRMGLAQAPDTSIEVVSFRPFYVAGQAERPGEYPYRPELTVGKAFAIAGGLPRVADLGLMRLEREAIVTRGELILLRQEREQLMAKRARLQAESENKPDINLPPVLLNRPEPSIRLLLDQERSIFDARREAFKAQIKTLDELKSSLSLQVGAFNAQAATSDTQLILVNKELQSISGLVDRGLAAQPRQLALERTIAQIEGEKLRVTTDLLKTREAISKADISLVELRSKRANEIAVELRETQARLESVERKAETGEKQLLEIEVSAPRYLVEREQARRAPPSFRITRQAPGGPQIIDADENTPVQPGDTITIELPLLGTQPSAPVVGRGQLSLK